MSFEYIAQAYGKTFRKGQIVKTTPFKDQPSRLGVVVKATHHIYVRLSGEKHAQPCIANRMAIL